MSSMLFRSYRPAPPLSEFVDSFWLIAGGQTPRKERILPSGTFEMVINLCEDEVRIHDPAQPQRYKSFSGAVISGTYSRVFVCDAMQHELMLGVHFKPGGAFPFLDAPASELTNAHADLADFWGRSALELRERLCEVTIPADRFRVMEDVLKHRLRNSPKRNSDVQKALDALARTDTGASVREIAQAVGLSQRWLIRNFRAQVGLTPKLFCRLQRFQQARTLAEKRNKVDWAELSSNCGYFDQSHLIHDFQEFSGSTPGEYLRLHQQDERLKDNHVPLPC